MELSQFQTELLNSDVGFDAEYYVFCNDDVRQAGADPIAHFVEHGHDEGRDPSPNFSASGYLYAYPDVAKSGVPALEHYLRIGTALGRQACPFLEGLLQCQAQQPTILLCGHLAEETLFGAELSLVDLANAYKLINYNVIISLPSAKNPSYIAKLLAISCGVFVIPQLWWQADRPVFPLIVEKFTEVIAGFKVSAVHLNTLVHLEPAIAAREMAIPVIMHVRELPAIDKALCERLHASPEQIRLHVWQWADHIIANSQFTNAFYQHPLNKVIYNCIDESFLADFSVCASKQSACSPEQASPFVVSMISSNVPKKGLFEFVELAKHFTDSNRKIIFRLVGPFNHFTSELQAQQLAGDLPENIEFSGYLDNIHAELLAADLVLNLSHFQESFGRTVLEAMAAGKVVICYRWGALPELLEHGKDGFLVPYGDLDSISEIIKLLLAEPARLVTIGQSARTRVLTQYRVSNMGESLQQLYDELWSLADDQA